jgi:hypothetical protein
MHLPIFQCRGVDNLAVICGRARRTMESDTAAVAFSLGCAYNPCFHKHCRPTPYAFCHRISALVGAAGIYARRSSFSTHVQARREYSDCAAWSRWSWGLSSSSLHHAWGFKRRYGPARHTTCSDLLVQYSILPRSSRSGTFEMERRTKRRNRIVTQRIRFRARDRGCETAQRCARRSFWYSCRTSGE